MLEFLSLLPLVSIVWLCCIRDSNLYLLSNTAILLSFFILNYSLLLLGFYDSNVIGYQFFNTYSWLSFMNLNYTIGADAISIWFLVLTNFLIILCIWLGAETVTFYLKWFYVMLFLTQFFLIQVFIVLDLTFFYFSFEAVLIPMFLLIMIWGSRERRIHAAYQFFLYTLLGSFMFLSALFIVYSVVGTTDYLVLFVSELSDYHQIILGVAMFIAFSVKIPLFPFHIWLPEAHVEAPTAGSVLLAGILLKMGAYGILRFMLPLNPVCVEYIMSFVYMICIIGVFYTALTTLRQIDMKKIIAYSSVGHMSFVIAGLFATNYQALEGAIYLMITHGIISPALFLSIGVLYDRYGSRLYSYYGGVAVLMPVYALFSYIFFLANFSLPGTASFVAEILVVIGVFISDVTVSAFLFLSGAIGLIYSLWLANRVLGGPLNNSLMTYSDLTKNELIYLSLLVIMTIVLGFYPNVILNFFHISVGNIF